VYDGHLCGWISAIRVSLHHWAAFHAPPKRERRQTKEEVRSIRLGHNERVSQAWG
jgi:hypothetical protein